MKVYKYSLSAMLMPGLLLIPAETIFGAERAISKDEALRWFDGESYLIDGFQSHLPVVVLNEYGNVNFIQAGESLNKAELAAMDGATAQFTELWSEPAADGKPEREKKDYSLHISEEGYEELTNHLWESPVQGDWNLLGNQFDKSLMQNYLALAIANDLGNAAFLAQFCEVFIERGNYWDEDSFALDTYALRSAI